jgi:hypothetical protein
MYDMILDANITTGGAGERAADLGLMLSPWGGRGIGRARENTGGRRRSYGRSIYLPCVSREGVGG